MKRFSNLLVALLFVMLFGPALPAAAANCASFTYTLTNGQTADANQVMANFNTLLTCANNNLAHNGANTDITSLSNLSTPLSIAQGGTGNTTGLAVTATALATGRTIGMTGDVVWTSGSFTGAGNVTGTATIQAGSVGTSKLALLSVDNTILAQMPTLTIKGNNTGGTANALDLTGAQVTTMLSTMVGDSGAGGTAGLVPAPPAGSGALKQFLGADGVYRHGFYESSGIAITGSAQNGTLAHGLGAKPTEVYAYLRCTISNDGWTAGEEILVGSPASNNSTGITVGIDNNTTTLTYAVGNANFQVINPSTGATNAVNNADWVIVIRARST